MGGILGFMYRQLTFKPQPLPSTIRLNDKVALITGANVGLGLESARELIEHGLSHLIIAVRSEAKGAAAKAELEKHQKDTSCRIEVWPVDQENLESIVAFSERAASLDRIDIVILNAGVKVLKYTKSPSGHESNVQVNHIGTALLSLLLVPHLQASAKKTGEPSRLTIVGSEGHFWCAFKEHAASNILEELDKPETFGTGIDRYYTSKLLNQLWMSELATHINSHEVIIDSVNPGLCVSSLHRHDASAGLKFFLKIFAWTAVQGAHCVVNAAVQGNESLHGAYLSEQKKTP